MTTDRTARRSRSTSMNDVANLAGVSRTTVSFVINDVPNSNIPAETQQRVWDAVNELGYRPNAIARNLRSQRTHTIGLISDSIATTPYAGMMIQGAQEYAWGLGKLLLLVNTGGDPRVERDAVETLLERQVEGILYASMYHRRVSPPRSVYEVPTVLVDCFVEDASLPSVVPDEVGGGRQATELLIRKGHRRIAMLNNQDPIPATVGRRRGYENALHAADLPVDESLILAGPGNQPGGYAMTMQVLARADRPTALFCFNDRVAMGAYQAASDLGLRIPDDLSIVGFDNQETIAAWVRPALTTMQLPHHAMGTWAAAHLMQIGTRHAQAKSDPVQQTLECPLVERASVRELSLAG